MLIIPDFLIRLLTQHYYFIDTRCDSLRRVQLPYGQSAALFYPSLPSVKPIFRRKVIHWFTSREQLFGPYDNLSSDY